MRNYTSIQRPNVRIAGFTLLELMIVLVVMAILVASAVAAYDFAVVKTRRSAAASCLMEAAQAMERRYTTCLAYTSAPNGAIPPVCEDNDAPPTCSNFNQINRFYDAPDFAAGTLAARTFTLVIAPTGPQQAKDTKCGTLSVNQAGIKGETGSAASANECF